MSNRIKTVLVPLSGSDSDAAKPVLDIALAVARRFDAHLGALYILPDPQEVMRHANVGLPTSTRQALIESAESSAAEGAAHIHKTFDAFCNRAGVPTGDGAPPTGLSASWLQASGSASDMVTHRGRLADLIVLPRPVQDYPPAAVVEAALMETGRAVLLVPPQAGGAVGDTVVVGWNGSKEAAAALAAAMPFLASARKVYILARREWNKPGPRPSDVVAYLARHGIEAEARGFEAGDRSVGETLLDEGREVGADLVVLGGYGHSRTREMVFGGVTQHVLVHADIPILLAH